MPTEIYGNLANKLLHICIRKTEDYMHLTKNKQNYTNFYFIFFLKNFLLRLHYLLPIPASWDAKSARFSWRDQ